MNHVAYARHIIGGILTTMFSQFLSPHDALKHHLTSLITDLIFLQPRVLE